MLGRCPPLGTPTLLSAPPGPTTHPQPSGWPRSQPTHTAERLIAAKARRFLRRVSRPTGRTYPGGVDAGDTPAPGSADTPAGALQPQT